MNNRTDTNITLELVVCLLIIAATLLVYWQVRDNAFVDYDDDEYVTENRHVQQGLSVDGLAWALTSTHSGNWHPLTWLSHMLDCNLFGLDAGRHHLTSVFFHIANAILLFLVLRKMTGDVWPSAFVAALFALHPLHVESVAWVSERKDVLSTLFWMLTMWAYVRYVEHRNAARYMLVVLFFLLGLMAKPMLVTLPLVLLALDYWPLGRMRIGGGIDSWPSRMDPRLFLEKIPLFILAAISCVVTFFVQQTGGAVASLMHYPLSGRIANALVVCIAYVWKMVWPFRLAFFYPYPASIPWGKAAAACVLLSLISAAAIKSVRRHPYFLVGWLWYIVTLVPVIGLVQVGGQAMADRYTYIPLIGIFISISWGVPALAGRGRYSKRVIGTAATALLMALMVTAWFQAKRWRDSITLFEHALGVTENNYMAHMNLGVALKKQGRFEDAVNHYTRAVEYAPDFAKARYNLGNALSEQGRIDEAIAHYIEALKLSPNWARLHNNLGIAYAQQGRIDEAIGYYAKAIALEPDYADPRHNLGLVLKARGRFDEAIGCYIDGLRVTPDSVQLHTDLALVLAQQGRLDEAIEHYNEVLRIEPERAQVHNNLGVALTAQGRFGEAIVHYREALLIEPGYAQALLNLGGTYDLIGEHDKAISEYMKVVELYPADHVGYYNIAQIYSKLGRREESVAFLRKAVESGFGEWESLKTGKDWENIRSTSYYRELANRHRWSR